MSEHRRGRESVLPPKMMTKRGPGRASRALGKVERLTEEDSGQDVGQDRKDGGRSDGRLEGGMFCRDEGERPKG